MLFLIFFPFFLFPIGLRRIATTPWLGFVNHCLALITDDHDLDPFSFLFLAVPIKGLRFVFSVIQDPFVTFIHSSLTTSKLPVDIDINNSPKKLVQYKTDRLQCQQQAQLSWQNKTAQDDRRLMPYIHDQITEQDLADCLIQNIENSEPAIIAPAFIINNRKRQFEDTSSLRPPPPCAAAKKSKINDAKESDDDEDARKRRKNCENVSNKRSNPRNAILQENEISQSCAFCHIPQPPTMQHRYHDCKEESTTQNSNETLPSLDRIHPYSLDREVNETRF